MGFQRNVFINCPFDDAFRVLLQPLLFTVLYLDFNPLISETTSSGNIRIREIINRIRSSKYAIHDVSRNEALRMGDLPRFNMPYELGLDVGCQTFTGVRRLKQKKCLILDREQYRYQQFMSDISGQDIKNHNDQPEILIRKIREWFSAIQAKHLPSSAEIWESYAEFWADTEETLRRNKFTDDEISHLTFSDFIRLCKKWILNHKSAIIP